MHPTADTRDVMFINQAARRVMAALASCWDNRYLLKESVDVAGSEAVWLKRSKLSRQAWPRGQRAAEGMAQDTHRQPRAEYRQVG